MKMNEVKSTNIKAIGHDSKTKNLVVEFLNNRSYLYTNVPRETFRSFLKSKSKGKYFSAKIKGVFSFTQIK